MLINRFVNLQWGLDFVWKRMFVSSPQDSLDGLISPSHNEKALCPPLSLLPLSCPSLCNCFLAWCIVLAHLQPVCNYLCLQCVALEKLNGDFTLPPKSLQQHPIALKIKKKIDIFQKNKSSETQQQGDQDSKSL